MSQTDSTYLYYPYAGTTIEGGGRKSVVHDSNNYSLRSRVKLSSSMKTGLALRR
jgi:hypothetical protein